MHKAPYVFPVLGGRKPEQLLELIQVRLHFAVVAVQLKSADTGASL